MATFVELQKLCALISARMVRATIDSLDEDIRRSLAQVAPPAERRPCRTDRGQ